MEEEEEGKVRALIEKATNTTAAEVDPRLLKTIKSVVRYSDSELRVAARSLLDLMKRDHSQVRYLSLLIIDELFMRSKLFRTIIVENLDQLLTLSVGFRRNLPLPAPPAVATLLREKAIEFLEKWNHSFGFNYRQIRLGFDYLKNTLQFQFPNIRANADRLRRERREREMRSREILRNKFEMFKENLPSLREEIRSTVEEIGECLRIVGTKEESVAFGPLDDEDLEEFRGLELRQIRLDSLKEGGKVDENSENRVVFDALREFYKLLVTKHLVSVQEGISVLVKVETEENRLRDSMLKEAIDIRNCIQSVKKQCEDSGFTLPDTARKDEEDEEDFWEEGRIDPTTETGSSTTSIKANHCPMVASSSGEVRNEAPEGSDEKAICNKPLRDKRGGGESVRNKLLADAPVINWGSFLDNWGSKGDVLLNQRGLELENHWGRVDYDAVIPAEKIAELNVRATFYREEQAEIPPCLAPLRNGGLCQRRDLKACPFHGPIVPRDDRGNPINESSSAIEKTDLEPHLVEQLAQQAVKNVRERNIEEARKRKMDKISQKRAKLAKIREHNEAVLKDAALASSSDGAFIGEDEGTSVVEKSIRRSKKETVASMLRKKVTAKDRLVQKLLRAQGKTST